MFKKLSVILLIIAFIVSSFSGIGLAVNTSFSDLPQNHWAYEAVMKMVDKGVLEGFSDGTFRPNDSVTREQFAKILVLALDLPKQTGNGKTFEDVDSQNWSYPYVETAKNYLTGYRINGKLYFNGSLMAVREDMAVAIVKAKGLDVDSQNLDVLNSYKDKNDISVSLRKYIAAAISNGIMEGYGDRTFGPQKTLTRAEACMLIYKSMSGNTGEKVPVDNGQKVPVDDNKQVTTKVFNDGNISFKYPSVFVFKDNMNDGYTGQHDFARGRGFKDWTSNYNEVSIFIKYSNGYADPSTKSAGGTTIDETYNLAYNVEMESARLNNIDCSVVKYPNGVLVARFQDGMKNYRFYGRGIGDALPFIDFTYVGNDAAKVALLNTLKNNILDTFKVVNPTQPISKASDKAAPYVVSTNPAAGAINVDASTTQIVATYSEPFARINPVSGRVFDSNGKEITGGGRPDYTSGKYYITLSETLKPGTTYTVEMPDVTDAAGNKGQIYRFSFTTVGTKIPENIEFNDGNVSFRYPVKFSFKADMNDGYTGQHDFARARGLSDSRAYSDGIEVRLMYSNGYYDPTVNGILGTTLEETYNRAVKFEYEQARLNNETAYVTKYSNGVLVSRYSGGGNLVNYRLYGRGIGDALPIIDISYVGTNSAKVTEINNLRDLILNSFMVVNPMQPVTSTTDTIAPYIISTTPAADAANISTSTRNIVINYSEPLSELSFVSIDIVDSNGNFVGKSGNFDLNNGRVVLELTQSLQTDTVYMIKLPAPKDKFGNIGLGYTFRFKTGNN